MSTNLISKMFESVQVRFVLDDNKVPWFVGKDIALALGYINTAQAVREKCREPKPLKDIGCYQSAPQQNQGLASDPSDLDPQTKMIKRADVSRLIARAKVTDKTEKFETWLFDDVLESIYDTGNYSANPNNNLPVNIGDILQTLVDQNEDISSRLKSLESNFAIITFKHHAQIIPFPGYDVATIIDEFNKKFNFKATVKDGHECLSNLKLVTYRSGYIPTAKAVTERKVDMTASTFIYNDGSTGITKKLVIHKNYSNEFAQELYNYLVVKNLPIPTNLGIN